MPTQSSKSPSVPARLPTAEEQLRGKLNSEVSRWVGLRKRPTLIFRTPFISPRTALLVHDALEGLSFSEMDVLIESPGGMPDPAFQIANLIRGHAKQVTVVVPRWSKSAATLIAVSMDEIILSRLGEMGPLDTHVPVKSDRDKPKRQSALEVVRAMTETQRSALQLWQLAASLLLDNEGLTVHGAYELASSFVGNVAGTHFSPIQLDRYGESVRHLEITKNYAASLLKRRGVHPNMALEIAERLVENYASHQCIIDVPELVDMGLKARLAGEPDEAEILNKVRPLVGELTRFDNPRNPQQGCEVIEVLQCAPKPTTLPAVSPPPSSGTGPSVQQQSPDRRSPTASSKNGAVAAPASKD